MDGLMLLLKVALIGYSIYSVIAYLARRGGDKHAMSTHLAQGNPLRSLTEDELAALQPFLRDPAKPTKTLEFRREGVFALHGEYASHGIATQGSTTLHDTIDGVDVLFPYDARDFLAEYNRAEVVFVEKRAILIKLNDGFDLLGGRARSVQRQRQEQQWAEGKPGAVPDIDLPKDDAAVAAAAPLRVEMLGQRNETANEVLERSSPGGGWAAALGLALGFVCILIAQDMAAEARLFLAAPALLLWAGALWLMWRQRTPGPAQKVNRVRGELLRVALPITGGAQTSVPKLFLGDKFALTLPDHWDAPVAALGSGPFDVEMRVADQSVVRVANKLSVDAEVRRAAPVFWGRHVTWAVLGAVALGVCLLVGGSVRGDLLLARAWLHGVNTQAVDASAMAALSPASGDALVLRGKARCELVPFGSDVAQIDCTHLRWGGTPAAIAWPEPDEQSVALHSGRFIDAHTNPAFEMLARMRAMAMAGGMGVGSGNPYAHIGSSAEGPKTVRRLDALVKTVLSACTGVQGAAHSACAQLQSQLATALQFDDEVKRNWAELVAQIESGKLTGPAAVASGDLDVIQKTARELATARLHALAEKTAQLVMQHQRGGVLLEVLPGPGAQLPTAPVRGDLLQQMQQWRELMAADATQEVTVRGLVVERGADAAGGPRWVLDAALDPTDPAPSLMRLALLAMALWLLMAHGVLAVRGAKRASARLRALAEPQGQRMA